MGKACFYETLGVSRTCTEVELKSAFRKAAMQFHPDRNPGDTTCEIKFKEVNEAYQCLSDPQKRSAYDRFGHSAFEQGNGFANGAGDGFGASMADIFDDLFGDVMGRRGAGRGNGATRGSDLRYNLEITLEEAFAGKTANLTLPTSIACTACSGSGAKPGAKPRACATCGGYGRVRAQQGFFSIERTCPHCHGQGEVIDNPCTSCSGTGRVTRERNLAVNIPAGVEDGTRIRLAGEGEAGVRGGPAGDLYIFVATKPHPFYQRDGADLFCRVPISMVQAALGGEIGVRTIDGSESQVKLPEGTQSGKQFKVRNKGMPVLRSREVGDLYIQVNVETPQNLTKRQRELLFEFESLSSNNTHPESSGFFAKMKDFFENLGS
jgi:molecular chaperone DnaJ